MFSKQTCVNCHYFCRLYRDDTGQEYKLEVTKEQRKKVKNDDFSWLIPGDAMGCYKGVWDQGHNFPLNSAHEIICKENRKGRCYYWRHMPGSFMQTVEDLQNRQEQKIASGKTYRNTIYCLLLTILGLFITVISLYQAS